VEASNPHNHKKNLNAHVKTNTSSHVSKQSIFTNTKKTSTSIKNPPYNDMINKVAHKHKLNPFFIHAIIKQESQYNPNAKSPAGAIGLMQLMPRTAKDLGVKNRYNPEQNIQGGTKHLIYLLKKYDGDPNLALAAYNAGEGNVDKYKGIPPFPETQDYVKKVTRNFFEIKAQNAKLKAETETRTKTKLKK